MLSLVFYTPMHFRVQCSSRRPGGFNMNFHGLFGAMLGDWGGGYGYINPYDQSSLMNPGVHHNPQLMQAQQLHQFHQEEMIKPDPYPALGYARHPEFLSPNLYQYQSRAVYHQQLEYDALKYKDKQVLDMRVHARFHEGDHEFHERNQEGIHTRAVQELHESVLPSQEYYMKFERQEPDKFERHESDIYERHELSKFERNEPVSQEHENYEKHEPAKFEVHEHDKYEKHEPVKFEVHDYDKYEKHEPVLELDPRHHKPVDETHRNSFSQFPLFPSHFLKNLHPGGLDQCFSSLTYTSPKRNARPEKEQFSNHIPSPTPEPTPPKQNPRAKRATIKKNEDLIGKLDSFSTKRKRIFGIIFKYRRRRVFSRR